MLWRKSLWRFPYASVWELLWDVYRSRTARLLGQLFTLLRASGFMRRITEASNRKRITSKGSTLRWLLTNHGPHEQTFKYRRQTRGMLQNCCPWKMNQKGIHYVTKIKMCQWGKQFGIHRPTFRISLHANTSAVKSLVHLSHPISLSILWPPGLFSGASHLPAVHSVSPLRKALLFSLSSLAFSRSAASTSTLQNFILHPGCCSSHRSSQWWSTASLTSVQPLLLIPHPHINQTLRCPPWVSSEPNCSPGSHMLLSAERLPARGFSFWAAFAWINSSEGGSVEAFM